MSEECWIKVKDRLPNEGQFVMCKELDAYPYFIAKYKDGRFNIDNSFLDCSFNCEGDMRLEQNRITHWRELPVAPCFTVPTEPATARTEEGFQTDRIYVPADAAFVCEWCGTPFRELRGLREEEGQTIGVGYCRNCGTTTWSVPIEAD